ncbi:hypothetical protein MNBD_ALPHA11-316 [hydrothermal vent metagenome]|uniref:DUF1674 domain-containing protein n=1 Tax=hydrothermal vent metagenome TaxID=652676 RepID=A0A3B0U7X2_9ZZZZ
MQSEPDKKPEPSTNAKNALREAAARKEKIDRANISSKSERDGRAGLDPARFGDWEVKGIASDF